MIWLSDGNGMFLKCEPRQGQEPTQSGPAAIVAAIQLEASKAEEVSVLAVGIIRILDART